MTEALSNLVRMLDLESTGPDSFRGESPGGTRRRLFGGHVAAQALVAAARTVQDAPAHSLHAYFLRPGDPHRPIDYQVQRLRDGRSFATRVVQALQDDRIILQASASFHTPEATALEHQQTAPTVPPPAACMTWDQWVGPRLAEMSEDARLQMVRERPIELRPIDPIDPRKQQPGGLHQRFWLRASGPLPDAAPLHQFIATYASDHTLLSAVMRPHGRTFMSRGVMAASVDHAIWFHRPFRMDQWLLYDQQTPAAFGGRGLAFGHFYDEQGVLVASMAQEGVVRQR